MAVAGAIFTLAISPGVPAAAAGRSCGHEMGGLVEALSGGDEPLLWETASTHFLFRRHWHLGADLCLERDTAGFDLYVITDHAERLTGEE